jgi:hypothetical protein
MARTGVADFERDLDLAARSFADQLLGARDALTGHELQAGRSVGRRVRSCNTTISAPMAVSIEKVIVAIIFAAKRSSELVTATYFG